MRAGLVLLTLLLLTPAGVHAAAMTAAQRSEALAVGLDAAQRGVELRRRDPEAARRAFDDAIERYRQLLDDGVRNGPLLIELGTTSARQGRLGEAALAFRLAQAYTPRDAVLRHNLAYVRAQTRTRVEPGGVRALLRFVESLRRAIPARTQLTIFAILNLLFWGGLIAGPRLAPDGIRRPVLVVLGVAWLLFGASVLADTIAPTRPADLGAVVRDEVVVRQGPGDGFDPAIVEPIHDGTEFTVRTRRPAWIEIELADGKTGWIPRGVARLGDDVVS